MNYNFVLQYILIAFGSILGWLIADLGYLQGVEVKGKFTNNFMKFLIPSNYKWATIYLTSCCISVLLLLFLFNSIQTASGLYSISFIILGAITGFVLLHAAIVDLACLQIITVPITISLLIALTTNILLAILGKENNIIAGAIAAIFMYLIILFSKKKGMGEGDLLVFILMGLILGMLKTLVAFYVMILAGSIVGLLLGIKEKKIKGLKIPFVPFMALGFLVALIWGNSIIQTYISAFLFF